MNSKSGRNCSKCGKFAAKTAPVCTYCKRTYHKLCTGIDYPIIPNNWKCIECNIAKVDISQTYIPTKPTQVNNSSETSDGKLQELTGYNTDIPLSKIIQQQQSIISYHQCPKDGVSNPTVSQTNSFNDLPKDVATSTPNKDKDVESCYNVELTEMVEPVKIHNIEPMMTKNVEPVPINNIQTEHIDKAEPIDKKQILKDFQIFEELFKKFKNEIVNELRTVIEEKINTVALEMKEEDRRNTDHLYEQLNELENANFNKLHVELQKKIINLENQNKILTKQPSKVVKDNLADEKQIQDPKQTNVMQETDVNVELGILNKKYKDIEYQHKKLKNKIQAIETSLLVLQNHNVELNATANRLPENVTMSLHQVKRKILIFTTNKTNPITTIASSIFEHNSNFCHHVYNSNIGTGQLIRAMKQHTKKLSQDDYCILMIGEKDFRSSSNYRNIVDDIREELSSHNHKNTIICLPIYRCNEHSEMYNWRIETFNSLIYNDIRKHGYAMLIDSNRNLTYSYEMFLTKSGHINNKGMATILKDIYSFITGNTLFSIEETQDKTCRNHTKVSTQEEPINNTENDTQSFRE